jgi:hypothetical protein
MTYGVDYYVKIATTNGLDTSTPVSATGNPIRIGQVHSGDIVSISADKISTGVLDVGATINVGASSGKRIELTGTGDIPFGIYGTGGTELLTYNSTTNVLAITGAITITSGSTYDSITAAQGTANTAVTNAATAQATANSKLLPSDIQSAVTSYVTTIDGGVITTGIIKSVGTFPAVIGSDFSTGGTAINLATGAISSSQFRIQSNGDAYFAGSLSSGISISAPVITGSTSITGGTITGGIIKSSSGASYISLGESAGTIKFKVSGVVYPGYITNESYLGGTSSSLIIGAPSNSNTFSTSTYIMLDDYSGGGIITLNSASTTNIQSTSVNIGADSSSTVQLRGSINISSQGWSPDIGGSSPTYKLLGITSAGTVAQIGVSIWESGSSAAPSNSVGSNGDLWFTSG